MSTRLEKLLSLLGDNVWHNVDDVVETLGIRQDKFQQMVKFLTEADLIQYNPATTQIKLNQNWKTLYEKQREKNQETQVRPRDTAVGTIIIPPQKTLVIQCTRITNLTDNSLELGIRINKKLREIAISRVM